MISQAALHNHGNISVSYGPGLFTRYRDMYGVSEKISLKFFIICIVLLIYKPIYYVFQLCYNNE